MLKLIRITVIAIFFVGQAHTLLPATNTFNYIPKISTESSILTNGAGITVGALVFFFLNAIRAENEGKRMYSFKKACTNAVHELGRLAFSPIKATLSLFGIETKKVAYPSPASYLTLAAALISGYLTKRIAFSFTPEAEFIAAQKEYNAFLNDPKNKAFLQDNPDIIETVKTVFAHKDHELVAGKDKLVALSNACETHLKRLENIAIADPEAQTYLTEMKDLAGKHSIQCLESVKKIKESPTWLASQKAAREAADRAAQLALSRKKIDLEYAKVNSALKQAQAIERQARAIEYAANKPVIVPQHIKHYPPVAFPPCVPAV